MALGEARLTRGSLELPLLKSLMELGGSAIPDYDLYNLVADKVGIGDDADYDIVHARPKWVYDLQWVRHSLMKQGEIDGSVRGKWRITQRGMERVEQEWSTYKSGGVSARPTRARSPADRPSSCLLEEQAREWIEEYYEKRAGRLRAVRLVDLLQVANPYAVRMESGLAAHTLIDGALSAYMSLGEESIFGVPYAGPRPSIGDWQELTGDPDFYLKLIRLMNDYPAEHRILYEEEWAKAVNRFMLEFLNEFSMPDGGIDWEKLVEFNSGANSSRVRND